MKKITPNIQVLTQIMEDGDLLNYSELARKINLSEKSIKRSDLKNSQLKQLQQYCNFDVIKEEGKHPLYFIKAVYDAPKVILDSNSKYCKLMYSIYKNILLPSNKEWVTASYRDIMIATGVFENNIREIYSSDYDLDMKDYITEAIYPFMKQWISRGLRIMEKRYAIDKLRAYRLYDIKEKEEGGFYCASYKDICINNPEYNKISDIFMEVTSSMIDIDYSELDYIPDFIYNRWQKKINDEITELYKGAFNQCHTIVALKASGDKDIKSRIEEILEKCPQASTRIDVATISAIKIFTTEDRIVSSHRYDSTPHRKEFVEKYIKPDPARIGEYLK